MVPNDIYAQLRPYPMAIIWRKRDFSSDTEGGVYLSAALDGLRYLLNILSSCLAYTFYMIGIDPGEIVFDVVIPVEHPPTCFFPIQIPMYWKITDM